MATGPCVLSRAHAHAVLLVFLLVPASALGFNWEKCKKSGPLDSNRTGWEGAIIYGIFNGIVSTSQFVSSTGACAMNGDAGHDRKVFLVDNLDKFKADASRGHGEYLAAYAHLSGCPEAENGRFAAVLKAHFSYVFGFDGKRGPDRVYSMVDEVVQSDGRLKRVCRIKY